jgi:hypothetical protein
LGALIRRGACRCAGRTEPSRHALATPSRPPGMPVVGPARRLPHLVQAAYTVISGDSKRTVAVSKYSQRSHNATVETLHRGTGSAIYRDRRPSPRACSPTLPPSPTREAPWAAAIRWSPSWPLRQPRCWPPPAHLPPSPSGPPTPPSRSAPAPARTSWPACATWSSACSAGPGPGNLAAALRHHARDPARSLATLGITPPSSHP